MSRYDRVEMWFKGTKPFEDDKPSTVFDDCEVYIGKSDMTFDDGISIVIIPLDAILMVECHKEPKR